MLPRTSGVDRLELTLDKYWLFVLRRGHLVLRYVIDRLSSLDSDLLLPSLSFVRNEQFDHVVFSVCHPNLFLKPKLPTSDVLPVTGFEARPQGV